jgi:hypothetical protein
MSASPPNASNIISMLLSFRIEKGRIVSHFIKLNILGATASQNDSYVMAVKISVEFFWPAENGLASKFQRFFSRCSWNYIAS